MKLLGIVLIVQGVLALAYQGIRRTTTTKEKLVDIEGPGPIEVTTTTEKKAIPLSPIVGGVAIVVGIALIFLKRRKK